LASPPPAAAPGAAVSSSSSSTSASDPSPSCAAAAGEEGAERDIRGGARRTTRAEWEAALAYGVASGLLSKRKPAGRAPVVALSTAARRDRSARLLLALPDAVRSLVGAAPSLCAVRRLHCRVDRRRRHPLAAARAAARRQLLRPVRRRTRVDRTHRQ
jgi:hypothetical protein